MTTLRQIFDSLRHSRSRLAGSSAHLDRDAVRENADLAAMHAAQCDAPDAPAAYFRTQHRVFRAEVRRRSALG